eukprot:g6711.t1
MPAAFVVTPPTAPAVLAEKMTLSRRSRAPRLGLSPRSWTSCLGSSLPSPHGDVATARHPRPPTALYSIGRDFPSPARPPLGSTSPAGWSGGGGNDASCFASRLLAGGQRTTSCPAASSFSTDGRRRLRSTTRLCGLRKPRGADGSPRDEGSDEEAGGGGDRVRPSRSRTSYGSSIPASRRGPPEEEDIWSKHSVFEFKSLNDPDTNACGYKGLSGHPRAGGSLDQRRSSQQGPAAAPDRRLPPAKQAGATIFEDLLEAERPASPFGGSGAGGTAAGIDDDLFRFREKGAIAGAGTRREVERRRRGPAGGGGAGAGGERSAAKVELATQLGVPAASTYDELRTAYRVEIKRCHPDLAGDNEFRVKFLERKFQKLKGCWDKFNAEQTAGGGATAAAAAAAAGADEGAGPGGSPRAAEDGGGRGGGGSAEQEALGVRGTEVWRMALDTTGGVLWGDSGVDLG